MNIQSSASSSLLLAHCSFLWYLTIDSSHCSSSPVSLQFSEQPFGHKKDSSLSDSFASQAMTAAVPTAPSFSLESPLWQIKRMLHPGKTETYDLSKVTHLDIRTRLCFTKGTCCSYFPRRNSLKNNTRCRSRDSDRRTRYDFAVHWTCCPQRALITLSHRHSLSFCSGISMAT